MEHPLYSRDWHLKGVACLLVVGLVVTGVGFWIVYAVTPLRVEGTVTSFREDWTRSYVQLNGTQDFYVSEKVFTVLSLGNYVVLSNTNAGRDLNAQWYLDSVS